MTATCREACCSVMPRLTVSELFERGFRRRRDPPLAIEGVACNSELGDFARFSLDVAGSRIKTVGFRSSSCATLIAYCELIAETVPGFSRTIAGALTARDLVDALPGVPAYKHDRAVLALAAFRAALDLIPNETGEPHHESRLHLRHAAP
jgi:NifU-like protein involved in Fe-S cluster formation